MDFTGVEVPHFVGSQRAILENVLFIVNFRFKNASSSSTPLLSFE